MTDVTYRLIALGDDEIGAGLVGQTALTPDLARLVPGGLSNPVVRKRHRLGIERTDWTGDSGKPKPVRSILIDAESEPGEWTIGAGQTQIPIDEIVAALPQRKAS